MSEKDSVKKDEKKDVKDVLAIDIGRKLREGYVRELQKPEFDPFERAAIIQSLLEDKGWSVRQLGREWGFPKSTLEDWLLFNRISEQEYNELRKKGFSATQIYRELREGRSASPGKQKARVGGAKSFDAAELNLFLRDAVARVRSAVSKGSFDESTLAVVKDLRNELNRLESAIERKKK